MTDAARSTPLAEATPRLATIHQRQVHRDDWPDFAAFDVGRYPLELRAPAGRQWMRRAHEELGSVHEFTQLTHVLSAVCAPIHILGSLSRLITDEVRHAELCGRMALACWPESTERERRWTRPRVPWGSPPALSTSDDEPEAAYRWAAEAILTSCCIGETLSRPLFEAAATVCTDPTCEAVLRQILRDEHLHATFGWEALDTLCRRLGPGSRDWLQQQLARRLAGFERSSASGFSLLEIANSTVEIQPGDPASPNLALLTRRQYATIFYATLESEILPRFEALGFDAERAWREREN